MALSSLYSLEVSNDWCVSSGKKYNRALLDLLLEVSEDGKVLNDEDIQEEVDTFMFAVSEKITIYYRSKFELQTFIWIPIELYKLLGFKFAR